MPIETLRLDNRYKTFCSDPDELVSGMRNHSENAPFLNRNGEAKLLGAMISKRLAEHKPKEVRRQDLQPLGTEQRR